MDAIRFAASPISARIGVLAHFRDQLLDSSKPAARVVRMDRANSAGMASVPGLQQRQHLADVNLADAGADRGNYARGRSRMRPVQELFLDERAPAPVAPREKPPRRARGTGIDVLDRGVAGDSALGFPQLDPTGRLVGVETRGSKGACRRIVIRAAGALISGAILDNGFYQYYVHVHRAPAVTRLISPP